MFVCKRVENVQHASEPLSSYGSGTDGDVTLPTYLLASDLFISFHFIHAFIYLFIYFPRRCAFLAREIIVLLIKVFKSPQGHRIFWAQIKQRGETWRLAVAPLKLPDKPAAGGRIPGKKKKREKKKDKETGVGKNWGKMDLQLQRGQKGRRL